MNEVLKLIKNRAEIRKYKVDQIPEPMLQEIIDTGVCSINRHPKQKWYFTVIQNKELIDKMSDMIKKHSDNKKFAYHAFFNAPTVILLSVDTDTFREEDEVLTGVRSGTIADSISVASESLGVSSCIVVDSCFLYFDGEITYADMAASENNPNSEINLLKKTLAIPEQYEHICTIALGYKDESPAPSTRKSNIVHYIR